MNVFTIEKSFHYRQKCFQFRSYCVDLTISFGKQHSPTTSSSVCLARISYMTKDSIQTLCSGKAYLLNFTCK